MKKTRVVTKRAQKKPPSAGKALRQREERLASLIELSSDWYWEQDEDHRFTTFRGAALERATADVLGKTPWEIGQVPVENNGSWDEHKKALAARARFTNFLVRQSTPQGEPRYFSISGHPVFDGKGKFKGYRGIGRDITAARRDEQLLRLEHSVARTLAESEHASAALKTVMQAVCETQNWECGQYWRLDPEAGVLRFGEFWSVPNAAIARFIEGSRDVTFRPGVGLAGGACQSGEPIWVPDVRDDPRVLRKAITRETGMHGAFVFPVIAEGKVIGVFTYSSREVRKPDERLLQAVRVIGSQIGQFLQRKHSEEVLRESEARFRALTELSSDWYWEQDAEFRFTRFEGRAMAKGNERIVPNFLGKRRWELDHEAEGGWEAHRAVLEAHQPFRDLIVNSPLPDGGRRYVSLSGEPMYATDGRFTGYRGVGQDITERKRAEERIQYLATHDGLTALPNRVMFSQLLNLAIQSARRYERNFAVLFIDLDRFKIINDTLGHEAGDMLLKEIATRLRHVLRSSDIVARLGGDEFVVLVQEVNEQDQVAIVARKILSAVLKPIVLGGQDCRVTASIGVALHPSAGQDEQSLMKNADIAMYLAKEEGKNNFQFYSEKIKVQSLERLALETNLRHALERNEFSLHYQAKLDLKSRLITGIEALLRWRNSDLGMVSPGQFIPVAEETGLIVPIGRWVLKAACMQNVAWQRAGLPDLCMAVNLSARQFSDESLLEDIVAALQASGMKAEYLELELTESMVMQNPERTVKLLAAIKQMGVRIAIDDFGIGYSSLATIKRFPIDTLKVDRSFIRDLEQNSEDRALTEAIIAMGKTLSLTVVAEGVETQGQETFLRDHACDEMQGYLFNRPLASEDFADFLRRYSDRAQHNAATG